MRVCLWELGARCALIAQHESVGRYVRVRFQSISTFRRVMGPWCLCQIDRLMRNKYTPLERMRLGMGVSPRVFDILCELTCGVWRSICRV